MLTPEQRDLLNVDLRVLAGRYGLPWLIVFTNHAGCLECRSIADVDQPGAQQQCSEFVERIDQVFESMGIPEASEAPSPLTTNH